MLNSQSIITACASVTAADLTHAGLLQAGPGCVISPHAVFVPADMLGALRPVVLGARCTVGAGAVLHGGVQLGVGVRIEEHVVVGSPEYGYAMRRVYPGTGAFTVLDDDVVLRSGAVIYAGVHIGQATVVGHHTLLRSNVTVGADSQLGHHLSIERATSIGDGVRMSPGTHLTAATEVADRAFLGAGIRTINDKQLIWRDPDHETALSPPRFGEGCKVGSGSTVMAGITIGAHALVGAGSVVTHDVPPGATAYGIPARIHRAANVEVAP